MPGEVEDEDALNAKLFALIEKNKKVKESDSMEKLMAPSYSLRSLYSDILSVKVRPTSASKSSRHQFGNSPKRGKIRPKSASHSSPRREQGVDECSRGDDLAAVTQTARKPRRAAPVDIGKYVDTDTWWEEVDVDSDGFQKNFLLTSRNYPNEVDDSEPKKQRSRTHLRNGVTPKETSATERAKKYKPSFQSESVHQYLKESKKKEKRHNDIIARKILEEANVMQAKCYTSVEEANSFTKYLGLRKRYAVFVKSSGEHRHTQKFREQLNAGTPLDTIGTIKGAGERIGKMAIEVTAEPGEPTTLLSMEKFMREHEYLKNLVKKHRSLIPANQQVAEAKQELKRRQRSQSNLRRRGGVVKSTEHSPSAPHPEANENAFLLPRSQTAFVDYTYDASGGAEAPTQKLSRKETEQYLRKILDNTVNVTKVLEMQLAELQSRGWNEYVL